MAEMQYFIFKELLGFSLLAFLTERAEQLCNCFDFIAYVTGTMLGVSASLRFFTASLLKSFLEIARYYRRSALKFMLGNNSQIISK